MEIRTNGDVYVGGNLVHSSDVRLKKNISTIDSALNKVMLMRGVEFDWRDREGHQIGIVAQELEGVVPELVKTNSDGYKGVTYSNIAAILIEAIKEQQRIIEDQGIKLDNINARLQMYGDNF